MSWRRPSWVWALAGLAVLGCVGTIVVFSPGYVSSGDARYQLKQALALSPLSDWHPPAMSLLWRALIAVTGTPASMAALQSIVLWASLLVIATSVWHATGRRGGSLAVLGVGVMPQVLTFVGVLWKDTQMAFGFLATAAVAMAAMRVRPRRPLVQWMLFTLGLVFLVYAVLVRKNAVFAAVPVFAMLVLSLWPRPHRATWLLTSAALVVGLVVPTVAISTLAHPRHTSQVSQVMLDDLLHVPSAEEFAAADVSPELHEKLVSARQDCRGFLSNVYWFCYGKGADGPYTAVAHTDEISSLWVKEMANHIPGYLEYRGQVFSRLLFQTRHPYSGRIVVNDLGLAIAHPRLEDTLDTYVRGAAADRPSSSGAGSGSPWVSRWRSVPGEGGSPCRSGHWG